MRNTWTGKSVCRRVTKLDMPDLFSDIMKAPPDVLEVIVKTLELRAADPQLQSMLESYLLQIELPDPAQILEIGSGTGPVARRLASLEKADRVVGLDPSPVFLAKARELAEGIDNLIFEEGDGRSRSSTVTFPPCLSARGISIPLKPSLTFWSTASCTIAGSSGR